MLDGLREDVSQKLSRVVLMTEEQQLEMMRLQAAQQNAAAAGAVADAPTGTPIEGFDEADPSTWGNPGRNTDCPCGSGKKFKHCHGALV